MSDVLTLSARCLRLSRRQIDALTTSLMLPVLMMVVFVELFGGAIQTGGRYVTYVVPGVLVLCTGFGSAITAVSVCQDVSGGIVDRFRAMNIRGAAVLGGHVVSSIARNTASTLLVIAVAFTLGFRPHADILRWLAAVGMLLAFVAAISWLPPRSACSHDRPRPPTAPPSSSCSSRMPAAHSFPSTRCRTGSRASRNTSRSHRSPKPSAVSCSEHRSAQTPGSHSPGAPESQRSRSPPRAHCSRVERRDPNEGKRPSRVRGFHICEWGAAGCVPLCSANAPEARWDSWKRGRQLREALRVSATGFGA